MKLDDWKNETPPIKPVTCDYCGCEIPEHLICTIPNSCNRYDSNTACPECAAIEIEKSNSIEIEID